MTSDKPGVMTVDRPSPTPRSTRSAEQPSEASVEPTRRPRLPWTRHAKNRLSVILTAVIVLLAVTDGVLWWQARDVATTDEAGTAATAAAREAVPTVLSYSYATLDDYPAKATAETTGRFKSELSALITSRVVPAATQKQIVTRTTVQATSTVRAEPDSVVLLLFVNQTTRTKDSASPRIEGARLRVTMQHVDDSWLISELKPV